MPIRPIDTISMPIRSQESSQVQKAEMHKQNHAQEQLAVQHEAEVMHDSRQTVQSEKSENHEYRYKDGKKGSGGQGQSKDRQKKEHSNEEETKKEIRPGGFDIRI